ncbi:MAG TPA: NAD(P)-dependent alcohol dehydrogenase [Herpetosiphonaceae bacterium]
MEQMMKAVVTTAFGAADVLRLTSIRKPAPKDHQVLVRIHASTVTSAECAMRRGEPWWGRPILGLRKPRPRLSVLGLEFAGEIEAVGGAVSRFRPGDEVFGFGGFGAGALAEYICAAEQGSLGRKPANLSYAEAAATVDGASTALFFLRDKGRLQPGQKVLVNGASGSIGTYAVQLAKYFGAEVTAVCSAANHELVRSLGADHVIDYVRENFAAAGKTYDLIFDTIGKSSFGHCRRALAPRGRYLATVLSPTILGQAAWTALRGGPRVVTGMSVAKRAALAFLTPLLETGVIRPVIDRQYPLEQIAEAHRYVDTGRKKGNVVISIRA